MKKIIPELMNEVLATIAGHYSKKVFEAHPEATEEEVSAVIANNWSKISEEAQALYEATYAELTAS